MKTNTSIALRIARAAAALVAAALIVGCQLPLLGTVDDPANGLAPGSISIDLGGDGSRTILPDVSAEIVDYDVEISSTSGTENRTDQTSWPVVFSGLAADTWQVIVNALDAGGAVVATGTDTVDISPTDTAGKSITIDIAPTSAGTGTIDITIEWPADTVDTVSASIDPESDVLQNIGFTMAADGLSARYVADWPAGNYTVIAPLFKNGNEYASVIEAVQVYDNLTSTAVITLTADDLTSAPTAPTSVSVYKKENGDFVVDWTDAANTETYYRIERTIGAGAPTVIESSLAAGTEAYIDTTASATAIGDYSVRVSAGNGFGDSAWSTATVVFPEIDLSVGGTAKSSGSTAYFGQVDTGTTETITVAIDNAGVAELVLSAPTISGTDAGDFSLDTTGMVTAVAPGAGTSFDVSFTPTTIGSKTAAISIGSNDQDEASYVLNLSGSGYHPYIYVRPDGDDSTGTGDKTAPYRTIQKAVDVAATNGWTIRAAEGTYEVDGANAPITITGNTTVTIEGGYDATTWARDVAANATIVQDTSTTDRDVSVQNYPQTPILVDSLWSGSAVIDGLTVNGSATGNGTAAITVSGTSAPVTIRDVTVDGGAGTQYSQGIYVRFYTYNVTIENSTINGGTSESTAGIHVKQDSGAVVTGSNIDGGVATTSSHGIDVNLNCTITATGNTIYGGRSLHSYGIWVGMQSTGTISNNDIDGGDSNVADGSVYGIYVYDQSEPTIERNTIYSGDADPDPATEDDEGVAEAVRIDDESHPVIRNNVIVAGAGENTRGISISAGIDGTLPASNPLIYNNTIDGGLGNSAGASGGPAWGIAVENTGATIKNNLIYVHGSGTSNYGIDVVHVDDATGTPTIEYNYVFVGGGDDTRSSGLYVGTGNNVTGTTPGFAAYTADNDPTNDDYALTDGSPVDVRGGGHDLSGAGVSGDFTGSSRTAAYDTSSGTVSNGGSGWSIGAHEFDG